MAAPEEDREKTDCGAGLGLVTLAVRQVGDAAFKGFYGLLEFIAAASVTKPHHMTPILGKRVFGHRVTRPGADGVDWLLHRLISFIAAL